MPTVALGTVGRSHVLPGAEHDRRERGAAPLASGAESEAIAREAGTDRGTVARYIAYAVQLGLSRESELTDAEVHEVAQCVQARPLPDPSAEWAAVAAHKEQITEWLERKRPLRLTKVHTLLVREHGIDVSYDTVRRFAMQELGWRKKPSTVRLDDPPAGQEAQVDFGKMGLMLDPVTQRMRMLWALVDRRQLFLPLNDNYFYRRGPPGRGGGARHGNHVTCGG